MARTGSEQAAQPRVRDMLSVAAPLIAVLSILSYAVVRVSYERFYERFGVSPEDVGASSTTILAASGAHVLAYSIMFGVVPYTLALLVFRFMATRVHLQLPAWVPRRLDPFVRWIVVIGAALVPVAVIQKSTNAGITGGYMAVVICGLVGLAVYAEWLRRGGRRPNWGIVTVVWCSIGVLWLNLYYLPSAAARAGGCVADDKKARTSLRFVHTRRTLPFHGHPAVLYLPVEPAAVTWVGGGKPTFPGRLLYLGSSGATAVLYNPKTETPVRVPATAVVVRALASGVSVCDDVHYRRRAPRG